MEFTLVRGYCSKSILKLKLHNLKKKGSFLQQALKIPY